MCGRAAPHNLLSNDDKDRSDLSGAINGSLSTRVTHTDTHACSMQVIVLQGGAVHSYTNTGAGNTEHRAQT